LIALFAAAALSLGLPPGEVTPKVPCGEGPYSYALYLPSNYDPQRTWPILYLYDARARGARIASLYRGAAEDHGWILAASNDTQSDDPSIPNVPAMQALWDDTHRRLSLDPHRVFLTGFSGGARLAWALATTAPPGDVAGVWLASAGTVKELQPSKDLPFGVFATVGRWDFNYYELHALHARLDELAIPNRLETFDGTHSWPQADLASLAMDFLDRLSMKRGTLPIDRAALDKQWRIALDDAADLAKTSPLDAATRYRALAADFDGLEDVSAAKEAAARIEARPDVKKDREDRDTREYVDRRWLESIQPVMNGFKPGMPLPFAADVDRDLGLSALLADQKRFAGADRGDSARRKLENLYARLSFYIPTDLESHGEYRRAALSLSIAARIHPESTEVWFNLARVDAVRGEADAAIAELQRSLDNGFDDLARIDAEPDFEPLRRALRFQALRQRLGAPSVNPAR
jgi:dienelactone hydrolase